MLENKFWYCIEGRSKNAINVEIEMDLKDSSERSYWGSMTYSDRKSMIEEIVKEYEFLKNILMYYYTEFYFNDLYYKKISLTFKKT